MRSTWRIEYEAAVQRPLKRLDRTAAVRLVRKLQSDLDRHGDPRTFGDALVGEWTGFWRYRVGDYRAIARIEDEVVTIDTIEIGHRREVYR